MNGIKRNYLDLSTLTMDNQLLPIEHVRGEIIWKVPEIGFQNIISGIGNSSGFFLTNKDTRKYVRIRMHLNRHCILGSNPFYADGKLYRDIDAKGVGYTLGYPPRFFSVRYPEMEGDLEMRGILHNEVAIGDRLNTEEMYPKGIRLARHIAHIELYELVDSQGNVVPRDNIPIEGSAPEVNMEVIKPTVAIRAMGTTSRVWDLRIKEELKNRNYVKEIIDDAINLISLETGQKLTPNEYTEWFLETLGEQLAILHNNDMWTDSMAQIHGGEHNVTLDCRFTDTCNYQTPGSSKRYYASLKKDAEKYPELSAYILENSCKTQEEANRRNEEAKFIDKKTNMSIAKTFTHGVDEIYPLGNLLNDAENIFEKTYGQNRL